MELWFKTSNSALVSALFCPFIDEETQKKQSSNNLLVQDDRANKLWKQDSNPGLSDLKVYALKY